VSLPVLTAPACRQPYPAFVDALRRAGLAAVPLRVRAAIPAACPACGAGLVATHFAGGQLAARAALCLAAGCDYWAPIPATGPLPVSGRLL